MPRKFARILLASFLFFSLFLFVGSFFLLYFRLANWACLLTPIVVSLFLIRALDLRREEVLSRKLLQAAGIVSGLPLLLAIFLLTGDKVAAPEIISLGAVHPQAPDFFAGLVTYLVGSNLFGLVPAFLTNLLLALFFLRKAR